MTANSNMNCPVWVTQLGQKLGRILDKFFDAAKWFWGNMLEPLIFP